MRKEFELTDEQYDKLMDAAKPVPYMVIGGHPPRSQQENVNSAWEALGRELGFKFITARPIPGKSDRFFSAETTDDASD